MSDDRYINGTCPMTCPNFKRQSESIAEYQRIEKTLQATITELRAAQKHTYDSNERYYQRIQEQQTTITELREACWCVIGSIQDEDDRAYLKAALKEKYDKRDCVGMYLEGLKEKTCE